MSENPYEAPLEVNAERKPRRHVPYALPLIVLTTIGSVLGGALGTISLAAFDVRSEAVGAILQFGGVPVGAAALGGIAAIWFRLRFMRSLATDAKL